MYLNIELGELDTKLRELKKTTSPRTIAEPTNGHYRAQIGQYKECRKQTFELTNSGGLWEKRRVLEGDTNGLTKKKKMLIIILRVNGKKNVKPIRCLYRDTLIALTLFL